MMIDELGHSQAVIDTELFTAGDDGRISLCGSICQRCDTTTFPQQQGCPRCSSSAMAPVALPRRGSLWAFTVQYFEPKEPYRGDGEFEPYGLGYIDLGSVRVESRLTVNDPALLRNGQQMDMCLIPLWCDTAGTTHYTFAFAPEEIR